MDNTRVIEIARQLGHALQEDERYLAYVEAKQANAPKARIHDLRHAAALDIIRNWVSVGKNLNALYPYLSSYLGHVSYTETDYYVHLSTDFYSDIESKMQGVNDYLYGDDDDE